MSYSLPFPFKNNYEFFVVVLRMFFIGNVFSYSDEKLEALYGSWIDFFACCAVKNFDKRYKEWREKYKRCESNKNKVKEV